MFDMNPQENPIPHSIFSQSLTLVFCYSRFFLFFSRSNLFSTATFFIFLLPFISWFSNNKKRSLRKEKCNNYPIHPQKIRDKEGPKPIWRHRHTNLRLDSKSEKTIDPSTIELLSHKWNYVSKILTKSKQCLNFTLGSDLVNISAKLSFEAIFSIQTSLDSTTFLMKWRWISMCLILSWYTWWFVKCVAFWLSRWIVTQPCIIPNSPIIYFSQIASMTPSAIVIYSAWVVDRATTNCKVAFQQVAIPNKMSTYWNNDFLVSIFST